MGWCVTGQLSAPRTTAGHVHQQTTAFIPCASVFIRVFGVKVEKSLTIIGHRIGALQLEVPRFRVLGAGESGRDRRKITRAPKHSANANGVVVPGFSRQH